MTMSDTEPRTPADRSSVEAELARERTLGGMGTEIDRDIPLIDLTDADRRQAEIDDQLWDAAVEVGFFQLDNHGIDQAEIDEAFTRAAQFFALPNDTKARWTLPPGTNSGWEYKSQVRPSTGTKDQKESYQITVSRMDTYDLWPTDDDLAGFRAAMERFEGLNRELAMRVLASFARKLGFADDFFSHRHDPASPHYQSTLRLLHYLPVDPVVPGAADQWRAGAHTDFDCLTLLHQVPGQRGLQVAPARDADRRADGTTELQWTPVEPAPGVVTCNIGDMLVRWSDDALQSTLHRVRMPRPDEYLGPRYSIAYFAQADTDALIEGPGGRYAPITADDFLRQRIEANYAASPPG
ncbi:MAG: 2-oxoglutarate and iron-dependent oxygenase domain-containing protein [Actinomycetota bacterium]|nr:2-oxoglutarate and iron-dependent oxygenase domain-containing protein [Actinomycetota bacterium]